VLGLVALVVTTLRQDKTVEISLTYLDQIQTQYELSRSLIIILTDGVIAGEDESLAKPDRMK